MVEDKVVRCVYSEVDTVHERNHTANHSSKTADKIVLQVLHDGSRGSLGWVTSALFRSIYSERCAAQCALCTRLQGAHTPARNVGVQVIHERAAFATPTTHMTIALCN